MDSDPDLAASGNTRKKILTFSCPIIICRFVCSSLLSLFFKFLMLQSFEPLLELGNLEDP